MQSFNRGRRGFLVGASSATVIAVLDLPPLALASEASVDPIALETFGRKLDGVLVGPDHAAYESARRTASFNPRFDRRPIAIVGCQSEDDIARSILFAREHELPLSVRSGGHDVLGASVCDAGLVIDTRYLTQAEVDDAGGSIRVGAGAVAATVNQAAGRRGMAVPLGCNSAVGVSGLTLGGGLGWFIGSRGATCDSLMSARIVTADGEKKVLSAAENSDLFWAIRGGGGNFGVVSEWTFRTHVQGNVVCGGIIYPGDRTREFLDFYRDFMDTAPDELTVEVIGNSYNEHVIAAAVCYSGDEAVAADVLRPLREFGPPIADGIASRPYPELEAVAGSIAPFLQWQPLILPDQPVEHGSYWQGTTVSGLTDEIVNDIDEAIANAPPGWSFGLGHMMRGACVRVPEDATPLLRVPGATTVHFDGGWAHRTQADGVMRWIDQATANVRATGADTPDYINYLSANDAPSVADSYGRHYESLQQLKSRYDAENLFRQNRNIRPAET